MIFYIFTLFPDAFKGYLDSSILGKSIAAGLNRIQLIDIRDFADDKHKTCDAAPYGGGPGMLLKPGPLSRAIDSINLSPKRVVYPTPSGKVFNQSYAEDLLQEKVIYIICGHYEGIDQRIIDLYVSDEISIGDYILFSGEVGAMVIIDVVSRLEKGVIKIESIENESFDDGLLEHPHYTRPQKFRNLAVPDVLVSGNHKKIREWRLMKKLEKTFNYRPDLLASAELSDEKKDILRKIQGRKRNGSDKNNRSETDKGR